MIFDRVLTYDESRAVLDEIRPLLTADRFHARGLVQDSGGVTQWHVEVDKPRRSWFMVSESGMTYEVSDGVASLGSDPPRTVDDPSEGALGPVALAFPERLLVWGQGANHYRPVLVQRVGSHSILITVEHGADPSMRATLVLDTDLGLITRVMNFISAGVLLVDVELGRSIERHVPRHYPELDVIYPEF